MSAFNTTVFFLIAMLSTSCTGGVDSKTCSTPNAARPSVDEAAGSTEHDPIDRASAAPHEHQTTANEPEGVIDWDCVRELRSVAILIRIANQIEGTKEVAVPSRGTIDRYLETSSQEWPRCSHSKAPKGEPDYYLANEGPDPIDHLHVLAYERFGNYGDYRHVLFEHAVICVSSAEWQKLKEDPAYHPRGRVALIREGRRARGDS